MRGLRTKWLEGVTNVRWTILVKPKDVSSWYLGVVSEVNECDINLDVGPGTGFIH